ncbi:hypothetical protein [Nocardia sp. NPDC059691]|uniref:hypothetical protein n=1 Tax=Nocardia sp. NPDC059691 TaxID=3346908 RepID=UPI00369E3EC5
MMLSYRMPREPSTPRTALWRKLKRLGFGQISDGLSLTVSARLPAQCRRNWAAD